MVNNSRPWRFSIDFVSLREKENVKHRPRYRLTLIRNQQFGKHDDPVSFRDYNIFLLFFLFFFSSRFGFISSLIKRIARGYLLSLPFREEGAFEDEEGFWAIMVNVLAVLHAWRKMRRNGGGWSNIFLGPGKRAKVGLRAIDDRRQGAKKRYPR